MTGYWRIGSLCTGTGALDLAAAAVTGATVAWHADPMPASAALLAHHHPGIPNHGDLTTVNWSGVEPVDIITAGWPCQPWSTAGKQKGTEDERAIWPAIARAVRHLRPRLVLLENVRAIVSKGELARAVGSLADIGYDAQWMCLRASDVGAPHRRERCFIAAVRHPDSGNPNGWAASELEGQEEPTARPATDTDQPGPQGAEPTGRRNLSTWGAAPDTDGGVGWGAYGPAIRHWELILGRTAPAPTQTGKRGGPQLSPRFVEWMMGLPTGWVTDVPGLSRAQQITLLGNGVVPQQAEAAYRLLLERNSGAHRRFLANRTSAALITCDNVTPSASAAVLAASQTSSGTRTARIGVCASRGLGIHGDTELIRRAQRERGLEAVIHRDGDPLRGQLDHVVERPLGRVQLGDAVSDRDGGSEDDPGLRHDQSIPRVHTRRQGATR